MSGSTGAITLPPRPSARPARRAAASPPTPASELPPLCIDLDGTLLRGDLLHEGLAAILGANPLRLPQVVSWLLAGRRAFKERVAAAAQLDVTVLPYREEVLELARAARDSGRRVLLVTAATETIAHEVAEHLGVFDEVVASGPQHGNLAGQRKAAYLIERFGLGGYEYVGDSRVDLPVWAGAAAGVAVDAPGSVRRRLQSARTPMRFHRSTRLGPASGCGSCDSTR